MCFEKGDAGTLLAVVQLNVLNTEMGDLTLWWLCPRAQPQDRAQFDQDFLAEAVLGPWSDSDKDVTLTFYGWGVYRGHGVFCFGMREDLPALDY